jgi:hypothetical protein
MFHPMKHILLNGVVLAPKGLRFLASSAALPCAYNFME